MAVSGLGICHLWSVISEDSLNSDILCSLYTVNYIIQYNIETSLLASGNSRENHSLIFKVMRLLQGIVKTLP